MKTTFNGHVDFSNSTIPTLPVDGNLTADDAVVNTLTVEAKTTFNGHVDFSNSYIPTLPVDGNLTAADDAVMNTLTVRRKRHLMDMSIFQTVLFQRFPSMAI